MTTPTPDAPVQQPVAQPVQPDWTASIPKEYASEKTWDSFKGKPLGDVLKSYIESQKVIGGSIRLPKADAKPEDRAKAMGDIYNKLGRPESPDKYEMAAPEMPPYIQWNQERLTGAKAELHKLGLSNDQANGVMAIYANELKSMFPDPSVAKAQARTQLIQEFGSEQLFTRALTQGIRAVNTYGDDELKAWLESSGSGNNPAFVRFVAKVGRELIEHGAIEPSNTSMDVDTAQAQTKINAILADKNDLYHSRRGTPGREERVKEVQDLYRIATGAV